MRCERCADPVEEIERQVRRRMMRAVGALVAFEEEGAIGSTDLFADPAHERDARIDKAAALLANLLALVMVERREEIGEIAIPGIAPVELHAIAHEHPGRSAF